MFRIVLVEPEIPQNTGAIGRLCVNFGAELHLIRPLGFSIDEKAVRRAGLDYWPHLKLGVHDDWTSFIESVHPPRMHFASTKTEREIWDVDFRHHDTLVFGKESGGLTPDFHDLYRDAFFRIPMPGEFHRSLNLSNAVAVTVFEAYRQLR